LTFQAAAPLVIDPDDPFGAGKTAGFALEGVTNGARVTAVRIDADDPGALVLKLSKRPEGAVFVTYAHAAEPSTGPYPANRGALRDTWGEGAQRRWALPARLKLTDGGP
jgi:hypothetical protein